MPATAAAVGAGLLAAAGVAAAFVLRPARSRGLRGARQSAHARAWSGGR